jgi:coenzyme F420-reducing hydrogenase alpha subunit
MNARTRTIRVETLARVEGEGALHIKLQGDRVADLKLHIFEPPCFFEAFLKGRHYSEAADITARIRGICPIAYQMSAVHAMERALGIRIDPAVRLLRRLFYCGEWLESHALHVYMLHAPEFLGYQDVIQMARDHRAVVERGLRLKKIGNRIVMLLGGPGNASHPGRRWRLLQDAGKEPGASPRRGSAVGQRGVVSDGEAGGGVRVSGFRTGLRVRGARPPAGVSVQRRPAGFESRSEHRRRRVRGHFVEQHVKHSNALHSVVRGRGLYLVGPLARFNLNFDKLPAMAREAAQAAGLKPPVRNPFRSIVVRAIELVFASDEALRVVREYDPRAQPRLEAAPRSGVGQAITEARRGILYHRYGLDENGIILAAKIVPPTSQNQKRIEDDLREFAAQLAARPTEEATWNCEQAIRNYDPCISCATHFLRMKVERE